MKWQMCILCYLKSTEDKFYYYKNKIICKYCYDEITEGISTEEELIKEYQGEDNDSYRYQSTKPEK